MPSNEQRRQAAKRKLERQLVRRAERAKKRRVWGVGITVGLVVVGVAAVFVVTNLGDGEPEAASGCSYKENPQDQPPKPVGLPSDSAPKEGTLDLTLKTSQGDIPLSGDLTIVPVLTGAVRGRLRGA